MRIPPPAKQPAQSTEERSAPGPIRKAIQLLGGMFGSLIGIAFALGAPVTYIILVVDTFSAPYRSFVIKFLIALTIDPFLTFIWPITWLLWAGMWLLGYETTLHRVFG